jgi:hypothetical protein
MASGVNGVEGDPPGMDPADDPGLACLLISRVDEPVVAGMPGVLAGQPIEVFDGAICDEFGVTADLDKACRVVWIDDQEADLGIGNQVSAFCLCSAPRARPRIDTVEYLIRPTQFLASPGGLRPRSASTPEPPGRGCRESIEA